MKNLFSEPYFVFCSLKTNEGDSAGCPRCESTLCGSSLHPEVLLFFTSAVQRDDLLGIINQSIIV